MLYLSSLTLPRPHASCAKPQEDKKGGGLGPLACCNNTSFKKTLVYTKKKAGFLVHAIVIVIWLL